MKRQLFSVVVLLSFLMFGCGHDGPADLPRLYPCKIKIVDKSGDAVEDASVVAINSDSKWASIGQTGSDGIAVLKTNGTYPGVPVGMYKILVTKYSVTVTAKSSDPEQGDEVAETLVFDKSFSDESTTPLQLTMEAKSNDVTFTVF